MKKILHVFSIILLIISGLWLMLGLISLTYNKVDASLLYSMFVLCVLPFLFALWMFKTTRVAKSNVKKADGQYEPAFYAAEPVSHFSLDVELVQSVAECKKNPVSDEPSALPNENILEVDLEDVSAIPKEATAVLKKDVVVPKTPTSVPKKTKSVLEVSELAYDFTCIDFETANNELNSACSIGLVAVKDLKIVKEEYFLIKTPTSYFNPKNTDIHGITYDMVKNEPSFEELWENLKHYFLASHYMAAHNARFDMSVLYQAAAVYGLEIPNFTYLDSITFSSKVRDSKNSLEACAEYFGIDLGVHHNALDDARTCAQIMIAAVNKSRFKTIHSYLKGYSSINPKEYCNLKPQKNFASKFSDATTTGITSTKSNFDTSHPFYGKSIVLTGELSSMTRSIAMQKIADVGGLLKGSVSTRTDYLIVGEQNPSIVDDTGMSTKEKKAYALQEDGCDIKIIDEQEFLDLL